MEGIWWGVGGMVGARAGDVGEGLDMGGGLGIRGGLGIEGTLGVGGSLRINEGSGL